MLIDEFDDARLRQLGRFVLVVESQAGRADLRLAAQQLVLEFLAANPVSGLTGAIES